MSESMRERVARALYRALYPGCVNTHDSARTPESDAVELDRAYETWDSGREGFAPGRTCRLAADAALAVVADVEGIAGVLAEHAARPVGSPHCVCGWRPAMYLNDTEADRGQHRYHQAEAVAACDYPEEWR